MYRYRNQLSLEENLTFYPATDAARIVTGKIFSRRLDCRIRTRVKSFFNVAAFCVYYVSLCVFKEPSAGVAQSRSQRSKHRQIFDGVHVGTSQNWKLQRRCSLHQVYRTRKPDAVQRWYSWTEVGKVTLQKRIFFKFCLEWYVQLRWQLEC